jgi:hypothetical protein
MITAGRIDLQAPGAKEKLFSRKGAKAQSAAALPRFLCALFFAPLRLCVRKTVSHTQNSLFLRFKEHVRLPK